MGNGKLCPNCGKIVPESKAYCMNCGISLGVKCPECGIVSPLGSKMCIGCGYSFEVKTTRKKKKGKSPLLLLTWFKKYANYVLPVLCAAVLIASIVFFFLPAFEFTTTEMTGEESVTYSYNAPMAIANFIGAEYEDFSQLARSIENNAGEPYLATLTADFLGFSYVAVLVCMIAEAIYLFGNIKHMTAVTIKKLKVFIIVGGACAVLQYVCALITGLYLTSVTAVSKTTLYAYGGTALAFAIIIVAWTAAALALLLGAFAKVPASGEEKSFGDIILRNRLVKFIGSKLAKKSKGIKKNRHDEPALTVTKSFTWYIVLLAASLVFTQALVNVASHILFLFLLITPFVMLVYILVARHALNVFMLSDAATVEKHKDYTYEFRINNNSILAYPFIDAVISLPQHNSVRCTERCVRLSMAPLSHYNMKNTVNFRFRGTYGIGVKCFYVYDFFRIFKYRVDIENITDVYVLPRKLDMDESRANAVADSTKRTVKSPITYDKLEVSDIRDYRLGDPLKSIHWKLSSKSEDFIVREYNTGTSNMTYVYCDLSARFPDEAPAENTEAAASEKPKKEKKVKAKKAEKSKDEKKSKDNKRKAKAEKAKAAEPVVVAKPKELDVQKLDRPEFYEDMNEYLADGVVELTVSAVLRELRAGRPVTLIWFDSRSEAGVYSCTFATEQDFNLIYKLFATAPLCKYSETVGRLTAMANETDNSKQIFVTGATDRAAITDLCSVSGLSDGASFGSAEVLLYNPEIRFAHKPERRAYIEGCRDQLSANGLTLTIGELPADPITDKEAVNQ